MVDDDDGRTPDHGHPISSPCEPNGSGELKKEQNHELAKKKKMKSNCIHGQALNVIIYKCCP